MLISLEITNYALIDQLKVNFQPGLNVITGETGAGKSIILGALGLVMGKRADSKVLFEQDKKCIVEAIYDINKLDLASFFESKDLDYEELLTIRREINSTPRPAIKYA
jgi:DNA repair protein RecN (Recombination protein N)